AVMGGRPRGISDNLNEGITQAITQRVAESLGLPYRQGYGAQTEWVEKYILPTVGMPEQDFFRQVTAAKDQGKFIADRIWQTNRRLLTTANGFGTPESVRQGLLNYMRTGIDSDPYTRALVDDLSTAPEGIPTGRTSVARNSGLGVEARVDPDGNVTLARVDGDDLTAFPLSEWPTEAVEQARFLDARLPEDVRARVGPNVFARLIERAQERASTDAGAMEEASRALDEMVAEVAETGEAPPAPAEAPQVNVPPTMTSATIPPAQKPPAAQPAAGGGGTTPPTPPTPPTGRGTTPATPDPDGEYARVRASREVAPAVRKSWTERVSTFRTRFLNRFHRFWRLQKQTGIPVEWAAERVTAAVRRGESLIQYGRLDDPASIGILKVLEPVEKHWGEFWDYAEIRRMEDILRNNPEAKLPEDVKDPAAALEGLRRKVGDAAYRLIEDTYQAFGPQVEDLTRGEAVRHGLLSQADADAMAAKHPHWIPFLREGFDLNEFQTPGTRRIADAPDVFFKRMSEAGSTRRLKDPADALYKNIVTLQLLIARNDAAKLFHEAMQQAYPDLVKEAHHDVVGGKTEDGTTILRDRGWTADEGYEVMTYKDGGEYVRYAVPVEWAATAKGMEAYQLGVLEQALRAMSTPLRVGAVQQSISYPIRNLLRDMPTAWVTEGLIPGGITWWKGQIAAFTKNDDYHRAAQANALGGTYIEQFNLKSVLDARRTKSGMGIKVRSFDDALRLLARALPTLSENIEIGTRVGVFLKLEGKGVEGYELSHRTLNATGNWDRAGTTMRVLNAAIPFLNVPIQAFDRIARAGWENPKTTFARMLPLFIGGLLLWLHNRQFETYELLPDYEKQGNWVFMVADGEQEADPRYPTGARKAYPIAITIPKPEQLIPFLTMEDVILDQAWKDGDYTAADLILRGVASGLKTAVGLDSGVSRILPPVSGTLVQLAMNRDVFREQDIIPQGEENRPARLQYDEKTGRAAVEIGRVLGISPRQIEFAIQDVLGGGGQQALALLGLAVGAVAGDRVVPGAAKDRPLTAVERLATLPLVKDFLTTRNTQPLREGYARMDRELRDANELMSENPEWVRMGKSVAAPGASITVDGNPIELTVEQRLAILEQAAPLMKQAMDELTASPDWQEMNDLQRSKAMDRARNRVNESVRKYVLAGVGEGLDSGQFIPSRVRAQYEEYSAIPAYSGILFDRKSGQ
ncbi:MAG: hypothetical protein GX595_10645, partial [Lentisphaerae bacterium]|nr:hypothetical protein [Lentisphaerota bacterium]